jgi:hypothetical protein
MLDKKICGCMMAYDWQAKPWFKVLSGEGGCDANHSHQDVLS